MTATDEAGGSHSEPRTGSASPSGSPRRADVPQVLLVTGSLGAGGTELAVVALARGLASRGRYAPRVALIGRGGALGDALRADGIPVDELAIDGPLRRPGALMRLLRLRRLARRAIVQTFLFDADVYGMVAAKLGRPRAVITTRRAIKAHRPDHLRGYRATNRFADRIVANSDAVRDFTVNVERAPASKVISIPNGVDMRRFATAIPAKTVAALRASLGPGVPAGATLVGAIGTIKEVKGQRVLWEALQPLLAARDDVYVVLAGEVTEGYGEALRNAVTMTGRADRVILPGARPDVPDLLAAIDVFVLPSLSEGMSNALLEAMAAGKAIVATDVGGNAENLAASTKSSSSTTASPSTPVGIIVPPKNPDALRAAIEPLCGSAPAVVAERRRLGAAAAARALKEYALPVMLARYEALYDELLGSRRR